jgi:3-amino-5-hydroxybenzoate synthase
VAQTLLSVLINDTVSAKGKYMCGDKLAINGGEPAKRKQVPQWPVYDQRELEAVAGVIESRQWWRIAGSQVEYFEEEFAHYHAAHRALAVTNGTQALEIALAAAGLSRGDEVIIPAFTFISTATAVLRMNLVPVLADVDADTYCLDPEAAAMAITPNTRAIMPVHIGGHITDMDAIAEIADQYELLVIEDAAQVPGAEWKGHPVGALRTAGIFSFQAAKLITAGEGGIILSNDDDFIERCFLYSSCGRPATDRTYNHTVLGTNCRMSELHAAILRVQLTRLQEHTQHREQSAAQLDRLLAEIPGITPQGRDPRVTRHPHYMYMFRYDTAQFGGMDRGTFVEALNAEGVPAFIAYPAVHRTPMFRNRAFGPHWNPSDPLLPDYVQVSCPVAEEIGATVVWLPHFVLLDDDEGQIELAAAIKKIQTHAQQG